MEYGLQMYSVRDITKTDLEGAMTAVAELGYAISKYTRLPALLGRLNERFMATKLGHFLCD